MTDHSIHFFADDAAIAYLGEGLLACTLAKAEWTHEAHLAACLYLLARRPDIDVDAQIADVISRFNESVGGVNDDHNGYHDTITRAYVAGVRRFLRERGSGDLTADVNALLASEAGRRDWPLRFYSRERLFSVEARRGFVKPDRAPLP
ncbi:hypothetical protein DAH55_01435 [Sphingomonas koreensis]|uniref:hypothetical protein n=1 Tax=Sphingomonas koreensis TaxID=93064 RepID=UPI000831B6EE|nr:hypothetical protein [Sphingomonas koreensis]PJI87667.1 hypothetical protein BDW16_0912 [Sphingomonas koreensis]RSU63032.1 hypothetical protein DAH56_03800 [Sphingomonas koreensis]RSU71740.1 hypothetical protein DAH55_01435 [Sphingomonas koreensis]